MVSAWPWVNGRQGTNNNEDPFATELVPSSSHACQPQRRGSTVPEAEDAAPHPAQDHDDAVEDTSHMRLELNLAEASCPTALRRGPWFYSVDDRPRRARIISGGGPRSQCLVSTMTSLHWPMGNQATRLSTWPTPSSPLACRAMHVMRMQHETASRPGWRPSDTGSRPTCTAALLTLIATECRRVRPDCARPRLRPDCPGVRTDCAPNAPRMRPECNRLVSEPAGAPSS